MGSAPTRMTEDQAIMNSNVTLSASAAKQINTIIAGQTASNLLRIGVVGGGCSGFSYTFDLDDNVATDDFVIERDGAKVVIDEASLPFLEGSEIDYVDELIGASFKIHNPNATAACGCGTSFSV
jgi:iron-sulfur cluster assembly accessory protein